MAALVGCSEEAAPAPSAAGHADHGDAGTGAAGDAAVDISPECPAAAPAPGATDAGVELAASPIEACEGYYFSTKAGNGWLHRTPDGCIYADEIVLRPDGSASWIGTPPANGTWKGDRFYFQIDFPANDAGPAELYTFARAPEKE